MTMTQSRRQARRPNLSLFIGCIGFSALAMANSPPQALSSSFTVASNGALQGALVARDPEGSDLHFRALSQPRNGQLSLMSDGHFLYQGRPGFVGRDVFRFMVGDGEQWSSPATVTLTVVVPNSQDNQLGRIIRTQRLRGDAAAGRDLPHIGEPLPQLGMLLFFSKSLSGNHDVACASCHYPALAAGDGLSLPIGVGALKPELLGPGRRDADGLPAVARNSPTVFNVGLRDTSLFWDSRIESLGKEPGENGAVSGIRTPDSALGIADPEAGPNLPAAQARFPVVNTDEMKSEAFEAAASNAQVRAHLAARLGNYGIGSGELVRNEWLAAFRKAFNSSASAEVLVTFDNMAKAIGEYERSMVFTNNAWKHYVQGDLGALTQEQKAGALLFFTPPAQGGAGCSGCHSGDLFSDGLHHTVAFPQIGPGTGDGLDDDFGRERETADPRDRYRFRTPSLLNVEVTAPYGHDGVFRNLAEVVRHYANPGTSVDAFFASGGWCHLRQFQSLPNCQSLYPNAEANSRAALRKLRQDRLARVDPPLPGGLNPSQQAQLVAFLTSLTDPCVKDRACLAPWSPPEEATGPDDEQLHGVDDKGNPL